MSLVERFCQQSHRTKTEVFGAIALLSIGVLGGLLLRGQPRALLSWLSGASTGAIALLIHRVVTDQQGGLQLKNTRLQSEIALLSRRLVQLTTERDELVSIQTTLTQQMQQLDALTLTQQHEMQTLHLMLNEWQDAATKAHRVAHMLKDKWRGAIASHQQQMQQVEHQHQRQRHQQVKAAVVQKAQRLYQNYLRKTEEEVAALKLEQERQLAQFQSRISELHAEIEGLNTQMETLTAERSQLAETLESLHRHDLPDIRATFEAEWTQNDRLLQIAIDDLQRKYTEALQPDTFPGENPASRRANKVIRYYLSEHNIALDARWIDRGDKEDVLYFWYRDIQSNPDFLETLNDSTNLNWIQMNTGTLTEPKFSFDIDRFLVSLKLHHSRVKLSLEEALRGVGTGQDFLRYISQNPIRYRVIGDPGAGKTPLMTLMVAHILQHGARQGNVANGAKMMNVLVEVSYPNAETSLKDEHYPLAPFLTARDRSACAKVIGRIHKNYLQRQKPEMKPFIKSFFQLWVMDESDNTLSFSPGGSATLLREVFNDGGHFNIGWILGGQSVNTKKLPNWTNDDRKKSVEIVLGAAKIRAWAHEYADDYYGDDRIKSLLKNLDAIQDVIARENEAISDEAKRLRIALVADARSPKLFLLPDFDRAEFDLDAYRLLQQQADAFFQHPDASEGIHALSNPLSLTASEMASTSYLGYGCPKCQSGSLSRTKKNRNITLYICDACGKSTSENRLKTGGEPLR